MSKQRDPYLVLGVARGADPGEVKRAYRKLVLTLHPDHSADPDSARNLLDVKEAYEEIGDERDKDAALSEEKRQETLTYSAWRHGVRFEPEPFATPGARDFVHGFRNLMEAVDEMLGGFVPEVLPGRKAGQQKDLIVELTLTPHEAEHGATMPLRIPIQTRCTQCLGTGLEAMMKSRCAQCDGRGFTQHDKQFDIVVPPGAREGNQASIPLDIGGAKLVVFVRIEP
jgi:molecular chaperone DnaJ